MEHPNNLIDSFTGVLTSEVIPDARLAISPNNLVLRGCVLRSTDWIVGVVLNTGKMMMIMMMINIIM
jgi:magnesium-transporting ATPase (P-type)